MFGNNKLYSFITYLTLLVAFLLATFLSTACNTATPLPPLGQAGQPTLVLVYTDGWAPWQEVMPIVNGLEINYSNQLAIQRINALEGDGPAIMEAYNIIGHPIILLVDKNGKEVQRFIGPQPVQTLDTAIKQLLATDPNNEITLDSLQNKPNKIPPIPTLQPTLIAEGKDLHAIHCAECHGPNGEGEENWKIPNEDGSYPAPPHNGTGHTWHHADSLLFDIVANGSSIQKTTMPAFGKQLSDAEILAILEYIKEWWGPEERAFQWQITWQSLPENNK